MSVKRKALFLDRDGVINDVVYRGENFLVAGKKVRHTAPYTLEEFKLRSGIHKVIEEAQKKGFLCILVTNQPDIKYGLLSEEVHGQIMNEIRKIPFDDVYICFHTRFDNCECKKPKSGMLLDAAEKWSIDLASSAILGDTNDDILAGKNAGCKTIIINREYNKDCDPEHRIDDLVEVLNLID